MLRSSSTPAFFIRRGQQYQNSELSRSSQLRRRIREHILLRRGAEDPVESEIDNMPVAVTADDQQPWGFEELSREEQAVWDEWYRHADEHAQRWATAAVFDRRGSFAKISSTPDIWSIPFDRSSLTAEEQAEWDKYSEEFPDGEPDDIDALDPGKYSPFPKPKNPLKGIKKSQVMETEGEVAALPSWGGRGKDGQEYSQVLLAHARALQSERRDKFRTVPTQKNELLSYLDSIKKEVEVRVQIMRAQVYEIGELLCTAKEALPHGEFLPWLAKAFGKTLSRTSALNAMRVYKACAGQPELLQGYTHRQLSMLLN